VITNNEIGLLRIRTANKHVGFGEARGAQARCGRLGNGSCGPRGEARWDFNKFLVNVAGEFFSVSGPVVWERSEAEAKSRMTSN